MIGAHILERLEHGAKYEVIQHDCLSELHYLRPLPFQIVLLWSLETADEFLRNRATFDYEAHTYEVLTLNPLGLRPK